MLHPACIEWPCDIQLTTFRRNVSQKRAPKSLIVFLSLLPIQIRQKCQTLTLFLRAHDEIHQSTAGALHYSYRFALRRLAMWQNNPILRIKF